MTRARRGARRSRGVRGWAGATALLLLCVPAVTGCQPRAVLRIGLASSREHLPAPRFVLTGDTPTGTTSDAVAAGYTHVLVERFPRDQEDADPVRFPPVWRVDDVPADPAPPRELRYGQPFAGARLVVPAAPLRACERYVLSAGAPGTVSEGGSFQVEQDGAVLPFGTRPPCRASEVSPAATPGR